jgi:uncharacterized protein (DUF1501 family)
MFRLNVGSTKNYCDGLSRRSFLQLGVAGMAGLTLPEVVCAREQSAGAAGPKRKTSVILIWLNGGPSHMDLYDLKPDAPAEYRGIWRPIRTKVPGFDISELFPKQAKVADKFSVVRSLCHGSADHFAGIHRMLTGKDLGVNTANLPAKFPALGAIASRELGPRSRGVPAYAVLPVAPDYAYMGAHMLGSQHNPFQTGGNPIAKDFPQVRNLNLAKGLSLEQLEDRRTLLRHFDGALRQLDDNDTAQAMGRFAEQAVEFVTGPAARRAFDLGSEDPRLRDQYGRNSWGQCVLLARRLVEAGSTFVTAFCDGWDTHWNLKADMELFLPKVDSAVAALLEDLDQRGLLDTTLVVLCGEFSRSPKMNDGSGGDPPLIRGTPGRHHWGDAMFCLLGGGGLRGGQIVGSTDRLGGRPQTRPLSPSNIHATIYRVLGIDPNLRLLDPAGRPIDALDDPTPINELF